LKLESHKLLSTFAFNFNLRHYNEMVLSGKEPIDAGSHGTLRTLNGSQRAAVASGLAQRFTLVQGGVLRVETRVGSPLEIRIRSTAFKIYFNFQHEIALESTP